jgi:hypothetical protein
VGDREEEKLILFPLVSYPSYTYNYRSLNNEQGGIEVFCKYCGPDVPAFEMYTTDICNTCAAIHDVKGKAHPDSDTAKLVEEAKQKATETQEGGGK